MSLRAIYSKHKQVIRFLLMLGVLTGYFIYLSLKYDTQTGSIVSAVSWSFFVLCTPIADGGFLLDFPIRLLFGIRMIISEIFVWCFAIGTNVLALWLAPALYQTTLLTRIFHKILIHPFPYWLIILLSGLGTFLSLIFGDRVVDQVEHSRGGLKRFLGKDGLKLAAMATIYVVIIVVYYHVLESLNISWQE